MKKKLILSIFLITSFIFDVPNSVFGQGNTRSGETKSILQEFLNLNDNQIPSGWELIIPSQEVVLMNGKLIANPVDAFGYLRRQVSVTSEVNKIRFEWDGNLSTTTWGMTNRLQINLKSNSYFAVYLQTATAWKINNNKLSFQFSSGNSEQKLGEWKVPLKYGEFHYIVTIDNNEIVFICNDKANNTVYVDQIINIPSDLSFNLQQIRSVDYGVNCTTGNSNWLDNISLNLLSNQQPTSYTNDNQSDLRNIVIKVVNSNGFPIHDSQVFLCYQDKSIPKLTDIKGEVSFTIREMPNMIIAYDPSGIYGMKANKIEQSSYIYTIQLPKVPTNPYQVGNQIDDFLDVTSTAYGYVSSYLFIQKALDAVGKGVTGVALPSLGCPGVFSINPIPVINPDGTLGLKISGVLWDKISYLLKSTIYRDRVFYQYNPSF